MTVTVGSRYTARALSRLRVGTVMLWPAEASLLQIARPTKPLPPRMRMFIFFLKVSSER